MQRSTQVDDTATLYLVINSGISSINILPKVLQTFCNDNMLHTPMITGVSYYSLLT